MLVCLITRNIFIDITHNNAKHMLGKHMLGTFYFIPSRGQRHWRFHHNGFLMKHYIGWMFCHFVWNLAQYWSQENSISPLFFPGFMGVSNGNKNLHQLWESLFVSRVFQGGWTVSNGKLWNFFFLSKPLFTLQLSWSKQFFPPYWILLVIDTQ